LAEPLGERSDAESGNAFYLAAVSYPWIERRSLKKRDAEYLTIAERACSKIPSALSGQPKQN